MSRSHPADLAAPMAGNQSRKIRIALYAATAFFYWVSLYLYMPTLPIYVQTKTDSLALVGAILSMYGLWQAIIRLPLGIWVDWMGRRSPFIILGLALAGLGAWLMGTADGPFGVFVGRSMTRIAAAAWVPLVVAFSSLFPADESVRATAILTIVNTSGRLLATSSTGVLNAWGGFSLAFFLASGIAGVAILFVLLTHEKVLPQWQPSWKSITRVITRRDVLLPSLLAAVSQYANWATTFGFTPILAKQLGGSDVTQSMLVTFNLLVLIATNLIAAKLMQWFGVRSLIQLGFLLIVMGVGLTAAATSLPMLFAAQFFIGMSQGINFPVLMGLSIRFVTDSERNIAMGLHQSVYGIGSFSGPWLSGILAQAIGLRSMLFVTAFITLVPGMVGTSKLEMKVSN